MRCGIIKRSQLSNSRKTDRYVSYKKEIVRAEQTENIFWSVVEFRRLGLVQVGHQSKQNATVDSVDDWIKIDFVTKIGV